MVMRKTTNDRGPPLTYGCVCSGISAPTLAAKSLGWKTKFFSEIEAFPRAVLSHHYPAVPLHHDFTTIERNTYGPVELLVGGTPCQSFSVAGKRLGLDDPRGKLALEFVRLAERVDAQWMVFENVSGLLSSARGEDFAAFISAVTGQEYGPPATGWQNAGIAAAKPGRWGIAWRILDAQYFGVAQRRRRVFVVGYRGGWQPAAAVLLEPEGLRGNPPPSREKREAVAALTATGVGTCGADDNQGQARHLISDGWPAEIASTLNAHFATKQGLENQHINQGCPLFLPVTHSLTGEGFDASEDGTGRGTPIIPILEAGARTGKSTTDPRAGIGVGNPGDPMFTLQSGKQHAIAFSCKDNGRDATDELAPTLRSMNSAGGRQNGGGQLAIAMSIRGREGGATAELAGDVMPSIRASQGGGDKPHILMSSAVRRLTPRECERLQGMPDDYTLIPWRKKPASECPDGPRYKAIGNSMAVPVVRWIFERIEHVRSAVRIAA